MVKVTRVTASLLSHQKEDRHRHYVLAHNRDSVRASQRHSDKKCELSLSVRDDVPKAGLITRPTREHPDPRTRLVAHDMMPRFKQSSGEKTGKTAGGGDEATDLSMNRIPASQPKIIRLQIQDSLFALMLWMHALRH